MVGVDLFAGAGGLSLGATQAGIRVVLAVEVDPHAARTYAANHPETRLLIQDIRKVRRIPVPKSDEPTILFGGPPCQGFSTSNQRTRSKTNAANWLFLDLIRLAEQWRPDWIVIENVKGMKDTEGGVFLSDVLKQLDRLKYAASMWVLNAADYGVPQRRSRLFVVGSREGAHLPEPPPTGNGVPRVTVHDAIHDLPTLENGASVDTVSYAREAVSTYARSLRGGLMQCSNHLVTKNSPTVIARYAHIPQGGNWKSIPARLMRNYRDRTSCHTGIYYRLREDAPAVVLGNFRKNMLIHPCEDRGLSVREAARLQSFPDWYVFCGSIGFQQQQVGNAVPPLLASSVFAHIRSCSVAPKG